MSTILFIANVWLHDTHKGLHFFHRGSCSCDLLKLILIIYVTFFFQRFPVNMMQHVFWVYFHFTGLFIVHFHSVEYFYPCCLVIISLIFISHLHIYFFLINIKVLLLIFNLIIWRVFMTGWFTCFYSIICFIISMIMDAFQLTMFLDCALNYGCLFFT